MSDHLDSAARALRAVLSELHPERSWVVSVKEGERAKTHRLAAPLSWNVDRATGDDADALGDVHTLPAPDAPDDHAIDEAA